jgi:hypothetical protein
MSPAHEPSNDDQTHDPDAWEPIDGRCNARKTDGSGLCRNTAGKGTDHRGLGACSRHGGSTRNGRKHAQKLEVDMRMRDLLVEHGRDPATIDPASELLAILGDTLATRDVLQLLVADLAPYGTPAYVEYPVGPDGEPGMGKPTYRPAEPAGVYGPDHQGDGKPHVLVTMLADWSDRAAKQAKLAIDAGIDERRVRIVEAQAEQLGQVVRAVASGLIGMIEDQAVARTLNTALPGIVRQAIETSGVIDTTGEDA